ncbi:MAG: CapA family protein [Caldicoprobacterales bacterium]|jgi:poly-gamma-glutamate capsule biosynthesis protein CapA/YwtB (metallophosphatase superfamily)
MKFTAVGDMLIQRRLPGEYEGFREVSQYIKKGDVRFFNLETTLNRGDCFASQFSGGSWLRTDPEVLEDARKFGFNILTFANNHTMDFSYDGLLKTLDAVNKYGFPNSGVGRNLGEAAAPAYLDTLSGRAALISVVSSFEPSAMAGEQSRRVIGRPGVNGLRYNEKYYVTKEYMDILKKIAEETAINGKDDISRAEGYLPPVPEGCFYFKNILFEEGEETKRVTKVNQKDMQRVEKAIYEAQLQADYIIISVHSHEIQGTKKETPDDFLVEFAHRCIDKGAHAVIGHGPHLLRPIEIYKGRPIFYSLGDFVLQNENIPFAPEDFFEKYGLNSDYTMRDLFKTRSRDFTVGLQTKKEMFETVIPYWEMENGELKILELMPVELGFGLPRSRNGWPAPARDLSFMERLKEMSAPYGTEIKIENGICRVLL